VTVTVVAAQDHHDPESLASVIMIYPPRPRQPGSEPECSESDGGAAASGTVPLGQRVVRRQIAARAGHHPRASLSGAGTRAVAFKLNPAAAAEAAAERDQPESPYGHGDTPRSGPGRAHRPRHPGRGCTASDQLESP
jgi:hypothetical protein